MTHGRYGGIHSVLVAAGWCVSLTLAIAIVAAPGSERADDSPSPGDAPRVAQPVAVASPIRGSLVICGGGTLSDAIMERFVELAGGTTARLVVISTANDAADGDHPETLLEPWEHYDLAEVSLLHTRSRDRANDEAFAAPLAKATAVWFVGGQQYRVMDAYRDTAVERALHALLERGGVIGGTSAGAAIMSKVMIRGGNPQAEVEQGFGFLPGGIVDQHFLVRDRLNRLLGVLRHHPGNFGVGIDEGTALVVQGRRIRVMGDSFATVFLIAGGGQPAKINALHDGDEVDLIELSRDAVARASSGSSEHESSATTESASNARASQSNADGNCSLRLELVDHETGEALPGLVQILDADGQRLELAELLSRGFGLPDKRPIHHWSVLPRAMVVEVPREELTVQALAGLETDMAVVKLDLRDKASATAKIPLDRFFRAAERGYRSANTHLHLRRMSKPQADRYLLEVPAADGLDIVFLSYLERAEADLEYTSNNYTLADLDRLSHVHEHLKFGNGEEHRHNLSAFGEGYGHVMLLDIPELIQPVSIGPGLTNQTSDGRPLRLGIELAREFGSKIIWCHNAWGLEDIPNWVMGKLHANNIFDGGTHGSYRHSFYRYLNAGMHVPFSTGTDWFMYDFSRVYVAADRPLEPDEWLDALAAGRSSITNGPILELRVAGRGPGETVDVQRSAKLTVDARAVGRIDFERIELIQNGQVVRTAASQPERGHHVAAMRFDLDVTEPCWLALRTPPPPVKGDPEFQRPVPGNDFGRDLFAHTSAVYVTVDEREVFERSAAMSLLDEMKESRHFIDDHARFADEGERRRVLDVYDEGIAELARCIEDADPGESGADRKKGAHP